MGPIAILEWWFFLQQGVHRVILHRKPYLSDVGLLSNIFEYHSGHTTSRGDSFGLAYSYEDGIHWLIGGEVATKRNIITTIPPSRSNLCRASLAGHLEVVGGNHSGRSLFNYPHQHLMYLLQGILLAHHRGDNLCLHLFQHFAIFHELSCDK